MKLKIQNIKDKYIVKIIYNDIYVIPIIDSTKFTYIGDIQKQILLSFDIGYPFYGTIPVKIVDEFLKNSINLKYCLLNYKNGIVNTFSDLKRYLDIRIKSKIEIIELEEIN